MSKQTKEKCFESEVYIKLIIFIILILLLILTSFNTGRKFYILKNTYFNNTEGKVNSSVAKWYFNAKIIMEVENNE